MAGTNLDYGRSPRLLRELNEAIQAQYNAVLTSGALAYFSRTEQIKDRICTKISASAPTDTANDYPRAAGDICIHYNVAGVLQGAYVATAVVCGADGTITAVTWTKLTVTLTS